MKPRPDLRAPLTLAAALLLSAVTVAAPATPAPVAADLTVGPAGSGADFEQLDDAIAAALPGDTILVQAGHYSDYATLVIDKPLTIVGAGSATTSYRALAQTLFDLPLPLYIKDLGPGEEVRVTGFELLSAPFGVIGGPTLVVVGDCKGPVALADLKGSGAVSALGGVGIVQVRKSDQVLLDNCAFTVGSSSATEGLTQPGLLVEDSVVQVNACTIEGGNGVHLIGSVVATDGSPGIELLNSKLRLSRSAVTGGAGGGPFLFFPAPDVPGVGAPALHASASQVHLRGGSGNGLVGGAGGLGMSGGLQVVGAGASAVFIEANAQLASTPGAVLTPGADGDGLVTAPPFSGPGPWFVTAEELALLAAVPNIAAPGSLVTLELECEPASLFLSLYSLDQGPLFELPGVHGWAVLDLAGLTFLPTTVIDGAGNGALVVPVPTLPSLVGTSLMVQGFASGPTGTLSISAPVLVAIAG